MNLIPPLIDSIQARQVHYLTDIYGGFVKSPGQNVVLKHSELVVLYFELLPV